MIALMLTAAFSTAQNATVVDSNNPLDGKAVVFESTAAPVLEPQGKEYGLKVLPVASFLFGNESRRAKKHTTTGYRLTP